MTVPTNEHNRRYERAVALLEFATRLTPPVQLSILQKWNVWRGLRQLDRVIELKPDNWAALWIRGKALQVAGRSRESLDAFARSHAINPTHPDIAREASISAMDAGQPDVAIRYTEKVAELRPEDAGLKANLALALLLSNWPVEAKRQISRAVEMDPADRISRSIEKAIDAVIAGFHPCPKNMTELYAILRRV